MKVSEAKAKFKELNAALEAASVEYKEKSSALEAEVDAKLAELRAPVEKAAAELAMFCDEVYGIRPQSTITVENTVNAILKVMQLERDE